ncbi:hypothetical protein KUTeg_021735, partial [Tegillarca granosa]
MDIEHEVRVKIGKCPKPTNDVTDTSCVKECEIDEDCDGYKKCCNAGCSQTCLMPNFTKCNSDYLNEAHTYKNGTEITCNRDSDCLCDIHPEVGVLGKVNGFANTRLKIEKNVKGFPGLIVSWKRGDIYLPIKGPRHFIAANGSLVFLAVHVSDSGNYTLVGSPGTHSFSTSSKTEVEVFERVAGNCPIVKSEMLDCFSIRSQNKKCKTDDDCNKHELCCNVGCGLFCTKPGTFIKSPSKLKGASKPGVCPAVSINGTCSAAGVEKNNQCKSDRECSGIQKCCINHNGCFYQCLDPRENSSVSAENQQTIGNNICPNNVPAQCCDLTLCLRHQCPNDPNAVCRINPCNGCKVEYFDLLNNKVNCESGEYIHKPRFPLILEWQALKNLEIECNQGLNISLEIKYNQGINISLEIKCNQGINISLEIKCNQGINISLEIECNQGINISLEIKCNQGLNISLEIKCNQCINISLEIECNQGLNINLEIKCNQGLNINLEIKCNQGINISLEMKCNQCINISLEMECNQGLNINLEIKCNQGFNISLEMKCNQGINISLEMKCNQGLNSNLEIKCNQGLNMSFEATELKINVPSNLLVYFQIKSQKKSVMASCPTIVILNLKVCATGDDKYMIHIIWQVENLLIHILTVQTFVLYLVTEEHIKGDNAILTVQIFVIYLVTYKGREVMQCDLFTYLISDTYSTDICYLPSYRGPCKANITRYYFNNSTKTCEKFMFGGCHSNGNNFVTEKDCNTVCVERKIGNIEDVFIPQCTKDGSFAYKQCHGAVCFCVNDNGNYQPGTIQVGHTDCQTNGTTSVGVNGKTPVICSLMYRRDDLHMCL